MDDDKDSRPPIHWGDFGALLLAGAFSLFGFYLVVDMLLGGHPLAILFREPPKQAARKLTEADWRDKKFTTAPGEVIISTTTGLPVSAPGGGFPDIRDWKTLRITLDRTMCFGTCPSYTVQISGDGSVLFQGRACVATKGEQRAQIPEAAVKDLVAKFRAAEYFSLRDSYRAAVTDNPTTTTSIAFDGRKKAVSDYVGGSVGMPRAVSDLESAIDAAAGTKRWISGTANGCP